MYYAETCSRYTLWRNKTDGLYKWMTKYIIIVSQILAYCTVYIWGIPKKKLKAKVPVDELFIM